jgi:sterol desaturase/sphingolipid hydroxylase (fatty acid hydroxylase superfamily)
VTPNLIALAIPLFFLGIGAELAFARARGRVVYRLGDAMGDLGCGIGQQLVQNLFATSLVLTAWQWAYAHRLATLPTAAEWGLALFGVEFAYYWWHRLSHQVNVLWAAHVVHHHSEDYNLAVALRQSVTTWLTTLPFYLPLAFLGVSAPVFAVVLSLSTLYQFWIHAALVPPLGWLERWLNTPALHRVHHAINPRYLDKNHAATFAWLDRLFGTWEPEVEPCTYGTTRPLASFNPLWAQVEPWVDLVRLARKAPTAADALKVFIASPAWHPEWMGQGPVRDPATKYDPRPSPGVARYALGQWVVLLVGVFAFLFWGLGLLARWQQWAVAFAVTLGLLSLPALVEGRPWARAVEAARLVVTAGVLVALF